MRIFFVITLISFFSLNASAQTYALATPQKDIKTTISEDRKALQKRHTLTAMQQLNVHLQKHLIYTQEMEVNQVEGAIELSVFLQPNGEITQFKIKDDRSPLLLLAIKEAMSKIDKILFRGYQYEGSSEIHIPIKFSMR